MPDEEIQIELMASYMWSWRVSRAAIKLNLFSVYYFQLERTSEIVRKLFAGSHAIVIRIEDMLNDNRNGGVLS